MCLDDNGEKSGCYEGIAGWRTFPDWRSGGGFVLLRAGDQVHGCVVDVARMGSSNDEVVARSERGGVL